VQAKNRLANKTSAAKEPLWSVGGNAIDPQERPYGMDRADLENLLREVESLLARDERNIAHQYGVMATLERGGRDASFAKMFLKRLESRNQNTRPNGSGYSKNWRTDPRVYRRLVVRHCA